MPNIYDYGLTWFTFIYALNSMIFSWCLVHLVGLQPWNEKLGFRPYENFTNRRTYGLVPHTYFVNLKFYAFLSNFIYQILYSSLLGLPTLALGNFSHNTIIVTLDHFILGFFTLWIRSLKRRFELFILFLLYLFLNFYLLMFNGFEDSLVP